MEVQFYPSGDSAVTMEFGRTISEEINDCVLKTAHLLEEQAPAGVIETVPTYRSLLVFYDNKIITYSALCSALRQLTEHFGAGSAAGTEPVRVWHIPCCYGVHFGPDLENVASHAGLTVKEVIERHCSAVYRIYMLGFLPGFVYLGGMDPQLAVPRMKVPRLKIPRGAVGIGGSQTGIYPMVSPGGWQLIGNTPLELYDSSREDPVFFCAGDRIRFEPVSLSEYYEIRCDVLHGVYVPQHTIHAGGQNNG